jgi:hypothetical protein
VSADFVANFVGSFYWALHLRDTINTPSVDNERKMKREKKKKPKKNMKWGKVG